MKFGTVLISFTSLSLTVAGLAETDKVSLKKTPATDGLQNSSRPSRSLNTEKYDFYESDEEIPDEQIEFMDDWSREIHKDWMCDFVERLRSFVTQNEFQYIAFESDHEELRNELANIDFSVEQSFYEDDMIDRQLSEVGILFSNLARLSGLLTRYDDEYELQNSHIHASIELLARVLLMKQPNGKPDVGISDYRGKVCGFETDLIGITKEYAADGYVVGEYKPFDNYVGWIKGNIKALKVGKAGETDWQPCDGMA